MSSLSLIPLWIGAGYKGWCAMKISTGLVGRMNGIDQWCFLGWVGSYVLSGGRSRGLLVFELHIGLIKPNARPGPTHYSPVLSVFGTLAARMVVVSCNKGRIAGGDGGAFHRWGWRQIHGRPCMRRSRVPSPGVTYAWPETCSTR
jgi:hypothetical protein